MEASILIRDRGVLKGGLKGRGGGLASPPLRGVLRTVLLYVRSTKEPKPLASHPSLKERIHSNTLAKLGEKS